MNKYSDRILFGADMVLTSAQQKDFDFMDKTLKCYKDLLEKRSFECSLVSDYYKKSLDDYAIRYEQCAPKEGGYCENLKENLKVIETRYNEVTKLNGLGLSPAVLEQIYRKNPLRFLTPAP